MNVNSRHTQKIIVIMGLCVLFSLIAGTAAAYISSNLQYRSLAHAAGTISQSNPEFASSFFSSLKQNTPDIYARGDVLLNQYGYTASWVGSKHIFSFLLASLLPGLLLSLLLVYFLHQHYLRRAARLQSLTAYLEAFHTGRESLLPRQEDAFAHLEDEIYKTVVELRQLKDNALKERQNLSDNLADIAHQLKTPLTSMSLLTQILAETDSKEDKDCIERLSRQIERLEYLVNSLLTLSKLDADTLIFEKEVLECTSVLTQAAEPIEELIQLKKQTFSIVSSQDTFFISDRHWTSEALLNLIKNCSEHTPDGGCITAAYSQNPLYTELLIEDSGSGFSKEELPFLFSRFYRGKNALKDSIGIGLALSKSLFEKQNAVLHAENTKEGHARFVIRFYR